MTSNVTLWKKLKSTLTLINEYRILRTNQVKINKIFFDGLFAEILIENKLTTRKQKIRYQFDFINTDKFYTDFVRLKMILKHLFIEAFEKAETTDNPEVIIQISSEGIRCRLSLKIRGYNTLNYNVGTFNAINKALVDIKGNLNCTSDKTETAIDLLLPDLYAIQDDPLLIQTDKEIQALCI